MPQVKLTGRVDAKPAAQPATVGLPIFDIVSSRDVGEAKITMKLQPYMPSFNVDKGIIMPTDNVPRVDIEISSNDLHCYFDDVNKGNLSAPRISLKRNVEVKGKTYKLDATYARKGNTSVLPKLEPLPTDILKLSVDLPKMGDVNAKLEYGTLTKVASCTLKSKVKDTNVSLKTDFDTDKQTLAWKANAKHALPEGFAAELELKNTMSGALELTKDKFIVTVPYDKNGPNLKGATAKMKFEKRLDIGDRKSVV